MSDIVKTLYALGVDQEKELERAHAKASEFRDKAAQLERMLESQRQFTQTKQEAWELAYHYQHQELLRLWAMLNSVGAKEPVPLSVNAEHPLNWGCNCRVCAGYGGPNSRCERDQ